MTVLDSRSFHISDVLTITSGRLLSTRHMDGIYDILGFATNSSPFTHQLPRLCDEVEPFLREEHPDLASVAIPDNFPGETPDEVRASIDSWLETLYPTFGTEVIVHRIPAEAHQDIDPLTELADKIGSDKVVVVVADE